MSARDPRARPGGIEDESTTVDHTPSPLAGGPLRARPSVSERALLSPSGRSLRALHTPTPSGGPPDASIVGLHSLTPGWERRGDPAFDSGEEVPDSEERLAAALKQIDRLSEETLNLYRHINLLYRIGEAIRTCAGQEDLCRVVLRESVKIVRAAAGLIELNDGTRYGQVPDAPRSALTIAIDGPQGEIGRLVLCDKRSGAFTAADEKLLRAISRQVAIAIENNRLIVELVDQNKQLEKMNQELKVLDQMKSEFVSNVSHELRTPLASIKGFAATMLQDEEMPGEIRAEFLGIINDESDKLITIINDLLDISKMMAGYMSYHFEEMPMEQIVSEVISLLGIQARDKGLKMSFECIDSAVIWVDRTRMSQVFINLIGNAVKFTDSGEVSVAQWISDGEVHVSVTDTGLGIAPDKLELIFNKFYRVENIVHTKEGTGLGLTLVRGILDEHQGRVDVHSRIQEGSTFTVHLPLAASRSAQARE